MNIPKNDLILILNGNQEMIDKYRSLLLPNKECAYCGKPFTPVARTDEKYCQDCRHISDDKKVLKRGDDSTKCRREYKRMYARFNRGTIDWEEFENHMSEFREKMESEDGANDNTKTGEKI